MDPQVLSLLGAGLVVEQVRLCGEIMHLTVRCEAAGANCQGCGVWSEAFHSAYERHLGDLPIAGRHALVDLRVRRFAATSQSAQARPSSSKHPYWLNIDEIYKNIPDKKPSCG